METGKLGNAEIVEYYRGDAEKLFKYLPWLESKSGSCTYSNYGAEGIAEHSVVFPVYDGTLLSFVKEAEKTCFMERNYSYVYTRNWIKSVKDEKKTIQNATIRDMDKLAGILSKYILGGRTKTHLWSEGVENGIYLAVLTKCKELLDFWGQPEA